MADELKNAIAQSLECPVCLNIFKDPKILSCSHTFCKACLDNLLQCHGNEQKLQCPVCRADIQVLNQDVSNLPTNLALKSLIDDVENQHQVCTNCKSQEHPQAIVYCKDCGRYLCITCQTKHSQWEGFNDHEVLAMSEIALGKVSVQRYRKCRKHPREDEECFCSDCKRFACFRCGVMEHAHEGHRVIEASVYESNHLESVEDLKSKADRKRSCIQKYVDFIDEQKHHVSNVKKQCIDDISKAYEESVRQLTEKKELLIGEVNSRTTEVDTELDRMKKEAQQQTTHMNTVTDLVANGTKIPLEVDALAAHDTLCQKLQETLKLDDPDYDQPKKSSNKVQCIIFEKNVGVDGLGLGKIVSSVGKNITLPTKITSSRVKNIALPTKNSMHCMTAIPDGKIAVGCHTGGINIFSADGHLQQTVLKDVPILEMGFLSDGRCIVGRTDNNITLYTTEWEKLNVRFETLTDDEGGFSGLDVDSDDQIYLGYTNDKKIQVFSPAGGKALSEIPCNGYDPEQITMFHDLLIIEHDSTISMIDNDGNVKHKVTKANIYPFATVTQDDIILIAWVNHDEGLVSIDEYNNELQQVKSLISDYKIEKSERYWSYLQEFRSGEIAFCTPDRLYIFY